MPRPIHFEIHAADCARAIRFYQQLFAWEFSRYEGPMEYHIIKTGDGTAPGIDGGLMARMGGPPADGAAVNAYVCTVDVSSVDESLARATALGGSLALPKMPIPGIGWLAYAKDTEGNIFGMMQMDPTVK